MRQTQLKPAEMRAWRAFLDAQACLLGRLESDLVAAEKMTLAEYDVLIQLALAPLHRLRMSELSERVRLSRSGLTRLVDRLGRDGLIKREHCASDRRGTYATLTSAGVDRIRRARPVHLAGVRELFAQRLKPSQLVALATALEPLTAPLPPAGRPRN